MIDTFENEGWGVLVDGRACPSAAYARPESTGNAVIWLDLIG